MKRERDKERDIDKKYLIISRAETFDGEKVFVLDDHVRPHARCIANEKQVPNELVLK